MPQISLNRRVIDMSNIELRRAKLGDEKILAYIQTESWKSKNRHKYLLQYHIIFVCKYRKKLLVSKRISDDIK